MVLIRKNDRKCKYCNKPPKKNLSSGTNKGYYRTCGSEKCLRAQYDDIYVCRLKTTRKTPINFVCVCCQNKFESMAVNHRRYCSECVPNKAWRGRAARYGIGKKQWDQMLMEQNNTCAICDRNPEAVDHCHKTGKVRGLLCMKCNSDISVLENKDWCEKGFRYLGDY